MSVLPHRLGAQLSGSCQAALFCIVLSFLLSSLVVHATFERVLLELASTITFSKNAWDEHPNRANFSSRAKRYFQQLRCEPNSWPSV